ncbi:double-cubane-cluster-containing anaerobic reductase [Desulfallas thermosapovorans]|uniref:Benzoyl-CoA reductase/2-hydroxyglutaryl-CoA dehydratase subunit BcrC/BadD/HgdB n=1 Tax=Desulfallas thermosapovorans DSM 6562 TaxID=1121431 RepID=A0A5S4ZW24_9FIRM|nr:double-cubane-cluster-containing anaerobic reductase [Desulfallas thermosapovorans]TYO97215.1 benzoyl-CoA reductase/2-hydroxyglutaryl-CoA dehydratase subunit BcrC/BadD/HgdB [Desulfallas thermosapovorans DSM 6562]
MNNYQEMWRTLGLNMEAHDQLLQVLPPTYHDVYLTQANRPQGMEYFDFVVNEIHGLRIQELQEHKKAGGKVIGAFCVFVPEEIVRAAGGICIGLCSGVEIGTAETEKVLPRNICPLIKSFMGFKLGKVCPYFESCDIVVGETTCDGKKKAFEILNDYIPVHVMETPHMKKNRDRRLWLEEVRDFARVVEKATGHTITADNLAKAVQEVNNKRRALQRLAELRKQDPAPISGKDSLLIEQIAMYDDVARFTAKVNALCDELEEKIKAGQGVFPRKTPRVIVTGTPMAIPNWKVPHIIESSGAVIVAEELCTGLRYFENEVAEDGQTKDGLLENLAARYLGINCAVFTPNTGRMDRLLQLVEDYHADGVIHCALSFCDPYAVEANRVEKTLKQHNIPLLKIETGYDQEDSGQLKTRVEAFIEMLG